MLGGGRVPGREGFQAAAHGRWTPPCVLGGKGSACFFGWGSGLQTCPVGRRPRWSPATGVLAQQAFPGWLPQNGLSECPHIAGQSRGTLTGCVNPGPGMLLLAHRPRPWAPPTPRPLPWVHLSPLCALPRVTLAVGAAQLGTRGSPLHQSVVRGSRPPPVVCPGLSLTPPQGLPLPGAQDPPPRGVRFC